jgi:hypothetical protein
MPTSAASASNGYPPDITPREHLLSSAGFQDQRVVGDRSDRSAKRSFPSLNPNLAPRRNQFDGIPIPRLRRRHDYNEHNS